MATVNSRDPTVLLYKAGVYFKETYSLCFIALEAIKVTFKIQSCLWGLLRTSEA